MLKHQHTSAERAILLGKLGDPVQTGISLPAEMKRKGVLLDLLSRGLTMGAVKG